VNEKVCIFMVDVDVCAPPPFPPLLRGRGNRRSREVADGSSAVECSRAGRCARAEVSPMCESA